MEQFDQQNPGVTTQSLTMMAWNIKSGGFENYTDTDAEPQRGPVIHQFISGAHSAGLEAVTLTDAHCWDEVYGGNEGIAEHLGYSDARFIRLEDSRLSQDGGTGIGIAFATDDRIQESSALDLGNRQGLGIILDIGQYGLQIANVYLDDMNEDIRIKQVQALMAAVEPGVPTVLLGDFNMLRSDMASAALRTKIKDILVRMSAVIIPVSRPLGASIRSMNKRRAYNELQDHGYSDADSSLARPTAPATFPCFGLDYAFYSSGVVISDFRTVAVHGESDHRPIAFTAHVA